jgi:acyl-CoA synthetase (NDP forming)
LPRKSLSATGLPSTSGFERAVRVDLQLVQVREPARERRELQLVAAHLSFEEAVIAGRSHDAAAHAVVLLC